MCRKNLLYVLSYFVYSCWLAQALQANGNIQISSQELEHRKSALRHIDESQKLTSFERQEIINKLHLQELKMQTGGEKGLSAVALKDFSSKITLQDILKKRMSLRKNSLKPETPYNIPHKQGFSLQRAMDEIYVKDGKAHLIVNKEIEEKLKSKINDHMLYALVSYYSKEREINKDILVNDFIDSRKQYVLVMEELKSIVTPAKTAKTIQKPIINNLFPDSRPLEIQAFLKFFKSVRQPNDYHYNREKFKEAIAVFKFLIPLSDVIINFNCRPLAPVETSLMEMKKFCDLQDISPQQEAEIKSDQMGCFSPQLPKLKIPFVCQCWIPFGDSLLEEIKSQYLRAPLEQMRDYREWLTKQRCSYKEESGYILWPSKQGLPTGLNQTSIEIELITADFKIEELTAQCLQRVNVGKQAIHRNKFSRVLDELSQRGYQPNTKIAESFILTPNQLESLNPVGEAPLSERVIISPRRKAEIEAGGKGWFSSTLPKLKIPVIRPHWIPLIRPERKALYLRASSVHMRDYQAWFTENQYLYNEEDGYIIWSSKLDVPPGLDQAYVEIEDITSDFEVEELTKECLQKAHELQKKKSTGISAPKSYFSIKFW